MFVMSHSCVSPIWIDIEVTTLVRKRGSYLGIKEREARWEIRQFSGVHRVTHTYTKVTTPSLSLMLLPL